MNRTQKVAALFRRHRGKVVSALTLVRVGGLLAWRTEVSRCRTHLGMDIRWNGNVRKSGYRYV